MKKTKMKRFIAIVLAVVMCFTMTTTVGFAANVPAGGGDGGGGELDVLVLGNSTSSGFGMPDFVNRSEGFATFNNYLEDWAAAVDGVETWTKEAAEAHNSTPGNAALGRMSNMSYPWLFKSYLVKEKGFSKVKLNPICLNGMRTDELRAYLDKDYYDKVSAREYAYAEQWIKDHQLTGNKADKEKYKGFMNAHIEMYTRDFYRSGAINENSFAAAQEYVQDSIKNADVIVVDLCGNNFGTYIGYRIAALLGMNDPYVSNTYETIKDVDDIPNGLGVKIDKLINDNLGNTDLMKNPLAKQIVDAFVYGVADCIVNYSADMEWINKNKKDGAKVIAVGLNNPLLGLKIDNDGQEIDFGQIAGGLFSMVNTYMKAFDKNASNYYFADVPLDMSTFVSRISAADSLEALKKDGTLESGEGYYAIEMIYESFLDEFMGGANGLASSVYDMIKDLIKQQAPQATFKSWKSLGDTDPITFNVSGMDMYLTLDTKNPNLLEAFGYSPTPLTNDDMAAGKIHLNKLVILQLVNEYLKPVIQEMLRQAVAEHSTLNFEKLGASLSDPNGTAAAIMGYISAAMVGDPNADMDEAYWSLLALYERFLLSSSVGVHPDKLGCKQKYNAVASAYDSELTAQEEVFAEVKAMLEELSAKVRAVATQENIDAAIQLIRQIKSGIEYLEQSGYDLQKIAALSAQLQENISKTLDMLGVTVEDLVAGGQFIADKVDPAVVAEQIQIMKEIVARMPEMRAHLNQITRLLEEEVAEILGKDLLDIQRIREALVTAVEKDDYSELIDELLPIGLELLEIGKAVSNLPEYEEAMTAYMMANEEAMAGLGKRVTALEEQAGQVKARTIDVAVKSEVTFPNGKARLTLNWEMDPIAEGYEMKINGEKVNYSEQGDMLVYEDTNAQIGKAYSYEITPYMNYEVSKDTDQGVVTETRTAYGKTFRGTVTPKVSVAAATIKKVKKAKKAFTVKWNAVSGANGYQVTYKLGKKSQTKNVAAGKTSLKVKKLKSGKKYTVKVRAYKTVNGKTYYGAWSAAKKVKVK